MRKSVGHPDRWGSEALVRVSGPAITAACTDAPAVARRDRTAASIAANERTQFADPDRTGTRDVDAGDHDSAVVDPHAQHEASPVSEFSIRSQETGSSMPVSSPATASSCVALDWSTGDASTRHGFGKSWSVITGRRYARFQR